MIYSTEFLIHIACSKCCFFALCTNILTYNLHCLYMITLRQHNGILALERKGTCTPTASLALSVFQVHAILYFVVLFSQYQCNWLPLWNEPLHVESDIKSYELRSTCVKLVSFQSKETHLKSQTTLISTEQCSSKIWYSSRHATVEINPVKVSPGARRANHSPDM